MVQIKLTKKEVHDAIKDKYGKGEVTLYKNGAARIDTEKGKPQEIGFNHEQTD